MAVSGKSAQGRPLAVIAKLLKLDLHQASKEIGSIAPFLIPFVKMTCVFFVLDLPEEDPSPTAAFVKALPVLSLAWLVCLHGVRYGNAPSNYVAYNRRILYGLLFSIVGDVLLVWQRTEIYFVLGMLSFSCTQICYILAFGFTPFGLKEFIPCLVGLVSVMSIIYPCISGVMSYLVPIYATLIGVMGWRSLACFTLNGDIPWKKLLSAVGAFLFVISDTFIGVNMFCHPVPFNRTLIMSTYYAAQLCMSLSVINFHLSSTAGGAASSSSRQLRSAGGDRPSSPGDSDRPPSPSVPKKAATSDGPLTGPPVQKKTSGPLAPHTKKSAEGMKLAANSSDTVPPKKPSDTGVHQRGK